MKVYKIQIEKKSRLDFVLRENLPTLTNLELSNSKIRRLIMAGCVKVNQKEIRVPSYEIFKNSQVEVFVDEEKILFEKPADDIKFTLTERDILFEDDYLIFVNKPSGFPTEKTIVDSRDNLHAEVVKYLWQKNPSLRNPPYVGIMHRLDKDTSGVILFTKKREVNKSISEMFDSSKLDFTQFEIEKSGNFCSNNNLKTQREIIKTYVAVVKNNAAAKKLKNEFIVKNFLGRISSKSSQAKWGEVTENRGGVIAITEFKVLKRKNNFCYLECHPVTGRTHQIRVHLQSVDCPILGDVVYGNKVSGEKKSRLFLHAKSLELIHPVTGEKLKIESPLPNQFL